MRNKGSLVVLEGIDLSGRTTQIQLLQSWLLSQGYPVTTTALRTSPLISDTLARAREGHPLQPLTYSILYCADHLDRTQRVLKPALERGEIVLADRYIYTAFAREEARGLNPSWVRNLYHFSVPPDAVFYLHISPDEAVRRRLALLQHMTTQQDTKAKKSKKSWKKHKESKQREQGEQHGNVAVASSPNMLGMTQEILESFRNFEKNMYSHYQSMQKEFDFSVIEGNQSIELVQMMLRRAVMRLLVERA